MDKLIWQRRQFLYFGLGSIGMGAVTAGGIGSQQAKNANHISSANAMPVKSTEIAASNSLPEFQGIQEWLNSSLSPCILSVLLMIVGRSLQSHRYGPIAIVLGLVGGLAITGSLAIVTVTIAFWHDPKDWRDDDNYDGDRDAVRFRCTDSALAGSVISEFCDLRL
jgi:hypothetical protein